MTEATENVDLDIRKSMLHKQTCFSGLTNDEFEELAGLLHQVRFKAGETIVTQGAEVDKVFLILSGTADVRHTTVQNGELHTASVATLGPGQSIGLSETGFYSLSGKRTATVVAITDMDLLSLSVASFHGFSLSHSHVNEVMGKSAEKIVGKRL